jgi:hypothetical protein
VFDFEHFNVVGYNSMPNQLPLFCGTSPEELSSLRPEECAWELFKKRGAATMMAEEAPPRETRTQLAAPRARWDEEVVHSGSHLVAPQVHDGCLGATSLQQAIERTAYYVQASHMPHHQWWRLFCSPHVKPCCWSADGYLNPGRRQCVGGGRELHDVMIGYLEEWLALCAPRLNLLCRIDA